MIGIYIHVPFCKRKCPYCDFYSVSEDRELIKSYVSAVCRNAKAFAGRRISADTVYFGGGTPSLLTAEQIEKILSVIDESFTLCSPEITMEANPCTVDFQKLSDYRNAGVNRISFGVQSADDKELEFLGRLHDFALAEQAVENAVKAGFDNISCDLMLGLAGQSMKSLERSLSKLAEMPINHISAYMLKIEEETPFYKQEIINAVADEDLLCDMYLRTVEFLEEKGFIQYEISNFAKDKLYSKHNLKYWHGEEYIGIGPAAHSFFENERYCCPRNLNKFIKSDLQDKEALETSPDKLEEYIMLNLRLTTGINLHTVEEMAGKDFADRLEKKAIFFEKNKLCVISGKRIFLTPKGFLVSNDLIEEFIDC